MILPCLNKVYNNNNNNKGHKTGYVEQFSGFPAEHAY